MGFKSQKFEKMLKNVNENNTKKIVFVYVSETSLNIVINLAYILKDEYIYLMCLKMNIFIGKFPVEFPHSVRGSEIG